MGGLGRGGADAEAAASVEKGEGEAGRATDFTTCGLKTWERPDMQEENNTRTKRKRGNCETFEISAGEIFDLDWRKERERRNTPQTEAESSLVWTSGGRRWYSAEACRKRRAKTGEVKTTETVKTTEVRQPVRSKNTHLHAFVLKTQERKQQMVTAAF